MKLDEAISNAGQLGEQLQGAEQVAQAPGSGGMALEQAEFLPAPLPETQACFGKDSWPDDIPVPQAWLEFDVDSVEKATAELESQGYRMLVKTKKEPWGQTVSRFIGPEGLLVGITFTPLMRQEE